MSGDIKKRFDRIVNILIQLQSKRVVRAQDLADRFQVSLRTIYRDIKSIEQAGVPLIGEAGTGYSIMDGYRLPPVSFTKEEALSFLAGEKLAEKFLDKGISQHYTTAMLKIKSILKNHDKEILASMENQIIMRKQTIPLFLENVTQALSITLEAIAQEKQIEINYQGVRDNSAQTRILEPIGIIHETGYWYIIAYCLERKDFRQFRSDRIQLVNLTDHSFTKTHITINEYLKINQKPQKETIKSKILVNKGFAPFMRFQRNHYGFISERIVENHIEMTFDTSDIVHEFPRWLMMFADQIQIIEPAELQTNFMELITDSYHAQKT